MVVVEDGVGNGIGSVRVVDEVLLGSLAPLSQSHVLPTEPSAALLDNTGLDAHVDDFALAADALTVDDVKLGLAERWGDLVLDNLDPGLGTQDAFAILDVCQASDVEPDAAIELQGIAASGRLRVAEQDAEFLPQLIDEDAAGACFCNGGC